MIEGQITTINPKVEETTRNIKVQATIRNTEEQLRPGMYVDVKIVLPVAKDVLVIPVTAVLYAPYSDSVFILEDDAGQAKDGQSATQRSWFSARCAVRRSSASTIASPSPESSRWIQPWPV